MSLPRLKVVLIVAAFLGVFVAAAFFVASVSGVHFFGSVLDLCLWPSSMLLMATEGHGRDLFASVVLVVSVAANAVYYCIVATVLWCLLRFAGDGLARVRNS